MTTPASDGYFHVNGVYPNVLTLFLMRSQQRFNALDGGTVLGADVLKHWRGPDVSKEHSAKDGTWMAPARVTANGGVRVKREGMWFILCPDAEPAGC